MANSKLVGSINLARLKNVGIMNVKGQGSTKKCIVIPIEDNDIYIKVEERTTQEGVAYTSKLYALGVEVYEKRETDQHGNSHHAKLSTSKEWINKHTQQELDERNKVYLGNFKVMEIPSTNQASTIQAPVMEAQTDDDLPF